MANRNAGRALDVVAVAVILKIAVTLLASVWLAIPALPLLPAGLPFLSGFGTLALVFTTAWMRRSTGQAVTRRPFTAEYRRLILGGAAAAGAVIVILAITVAVTGPHPWPVGQPEMTGGHYYLDVHGALTELTESEYRRDFKAAVQPFLLIPAGFDLLTLANLVSSARTMRVTNS